MPPTSIYILNSLNKELDTRVGRIGPYEEQDYVSLTCVSIGGKYFRTEWLISFRISFGVAKRFFSSMS